MPWAVRVSLLFQNNGKYLVIYAYLLDDKTENAKLPLTTKPNERK